MKNMFLIFERGCTWAAMLGACAMLALAAALGVRYLHNHYFGNEAYKTGAICLSNPQQGLALLDTKDITRCIILCACSDGATCHRTQVGEYLATHGWTVREVTQQEWGEARQ